MTHIQHKCEKEQCRKGSPKVGGYWACIFLDIRRLHYEVNIDSGNLLLQYGINSSMTGGMFCDITLIKPESDSLPLACSIAICDEGSEVRGSGKIGWRWGRVDEEASSSPENDVIGFPWVDQ